MTETRSWKFVAIWAVILIIICSVWDVYWDNPDNGFQDGITDCILGFFWGWVCFSTTSPMNKNIN